MGLHISHVRGIYATLFNGPTDDLSLSYSARYCEPRRPAGVIELGSLHDAIDVIPRLDCRSERLQQNRTDALTRHIPIGIFAERVAAPSRRNKSVGGQQQGLVGVKGEIDTAYDRLTTLARLNGTACLIQHCERRGAHCVCRHARALEIEVIRNPIRDSS